MCTPDGRRREDDGKPRKESSPKVARARRCGNLSAPSPRPKEESERAQATGLRIIEAELIRRACEGDERAVRTLYDRYAPRVYAVVRRIAADDDLAHDYAQEAWVRAIRALPGFRGESRLSTWLHRIALNTAIQAQRKEKKRKKLEAPFPEVVAVAPQTGDVLLGRRLEEALAQLPPGMRQVLILHDVEEWTHEEIAESLGVTPGTSKSQLFKARAKMRVLLAGYEDELETREAEAWSG